MLGEEARGDERSIRESIGAQEEQRKVSERSARNGWSRSGKREHGGWNEAPVL